MTTMATSTTLGLETQMCLEPPVCLFLFLLCLTTNNYLQIDYAYGLRTAKTTTMPARDDEP